MATSSEHISQCSHCALMAFVILGPLTLCSGWNVRSMDCGSTSSCVAADNSCITWGTAQYGELGYGPTGPK